MESWAVPLAALIISLFTFIASQIQQRRTASLGYADRLEKRITELERLEAECSAKLNECRNECRALFEKNVALMEKLLGPKKK